MRAVQKQRLCIVNGKAPVGAGLVNGITQHEELLLRWSSDHRCIRKRGSDLDSFIQGHAEFRNNRCKKLFPFNGKEW